MLAPEERSSAHHGNVVDSGDYRLRRQLTGNYSRTPGKDAESEAFDGCKSFEVLMVGASETDVTGRHQQSLAVMHSPEENHYEVQMAGTYVADERQFC